MSVQVIDPISRDADVEPARAIRCLPAVPPSKQLQLRRQSQMQVDVPEWRPTLEESLRSLEIRFIVETFNYEALTGRQRQGASALNPAVVFRAIKEDRNSEYQLFAATQKILDLYENGNLLNDVLQMDPKLLLLRRRVFHQLLVEIGVAMMDYVSGPHFTFIDPSLASPVPGDEEDTPDRPSKNSLHAVREIIEHTQEVHEMFIAAGVDHRRVIIGIPATTTGVLAAAGLKKSGININLYLVSGLMHAIACAELRPCCITIDVACVLSWYEKLAGPPNVIAGNSERKALPGHPGIVAIQSILRYYKLYSIPTKIIGRNFRTAHEVSVLGHEFYALSLPPPMLDELLKVRLPLCVAGFAMPTQEFFDSELSAADKHQDWDASRAALMAPRFPTAMVMSPQRNTDGSGYDQLNFAWQRCRAFMDLSHPTLPCPNVLYVSVTLTSLRTTIARTAQLLQITQESALYRVELRVLPLSELYLRRQDHGIWNDGGGRYCDIPPVIPLSADKKRKADLSYSTSLEKKKNLQVLGKGLPSSLTTVTISSPLPRRPPLRRSSAHAKKSLPARSPSPACSMLPDATKGDSIRSESRRGRYVSDHEVTKMIALTFEAYGLLPSGKTAKSGAEIAILKEDASISLPPSSSTNPPAPFTTATLPTIGPAELSQGKQQVLALSALLQAREDLKRERVSGKGSEVVQVSMVEGVDFF